MRLSDRLKKIEAKAPAEQKIIVVKYGNELKELSCGGEKFYRQENESECEFIRRRLIIENRTDGKMVKVLVGNF